MPFQISTSPSGPCPDCTPRAPRCGGRRCSAGPGDARGSRRARRRARRPGAARGAHGDVDPGAGPQRRHVVGVALGSARLGVVEVAPRQHLDPPHAGTSGPAPPRPRARPAPSPGPAASRPARLGAWLALGAVASGPRAPCAGASRSRPLPYRPRGCYLERSRYASLSGGRCPGSGPRRRLRTGEGAGALRPGRSRECPVLASPPAPAVHDHEADHHGGGQADLHGQVAVGRAPVSASGPGHGGGQGALPHARARARPIATPRPGGRWSGPR